MEFWMYGIDGNDKYESFRILKEVGIKSVVTGYDEEVIDMASEFLMDIYLCSGTYGASGSFSDERYLSEDINGNRHIWFGSTCPNKEEVRKYNIDTLKQWSSRKEIKGIYIDGARFASPCSSPDFNAFFTCFCHDCELKADSLGFNFMRMKKDVEKLHNSFFGKLHDACGKNYIQGEFDMITFFQEYQGVFEWLNFRRVCTTEHIINVAKTVKRSKDSNVMGIYIFTPSLAGLVGQSYTDLKNYVDIFSPMIYRSYKKSGEPACINNELARLARELRLTSCKDDYNTVKLISRLTGINLSGYKTIQDIQDGLPVSCVQTETEKARALLGNSKALIPIIQLDDEFLEQSVDAVKSGGADGVAFFMFDKTAVSNMKNSGFIHK